MARSENGGRPWPPPFGSCKRVGCRRKAERTTDAHNKKSPAEAGLFRLTSRSRSEAVLQRQAEQVGVAAVDTGQARATRGDDVDRRIVDVDALVGRIDAERVAGVPGSADRVQLAIVVGQARVAGDIVGRRLVDGEAAAQGEGRIDVPLDAD